MYKKITNFQTFIIWNNSLKYKEYIINKIKDKFRILKMYEITWSDDLYGDNLSVFYGNCFIYDKFHRDIRGEGKFLFIICEDLSPVFEERLTNKGPVLLNVNSFNLKQEIRQKINSFAFHSSNNIKEVKHDICLLLGKNLDDFLSTTQLDGKQEILKQDIAAARGYKNLYEFFYTLNETCDYCLLRGFECIPNTHTYEKNGDIDILVDDLKSFLAILNPRIKSNKNIFTFFNWENFGDNKGLLIHPKFVGDNYYDIKMEKKILETKVLNKNGVYIPSNEMYFWSLMEHGLFHKDNWRKYKDILIDLAPTVGVEFIEDEQYLVNLLVNFMKSNKYVIALHLDNHAARLNLNNIPQFLYKKIPTFYCYSNKNSTTVFSEKAIYLIPDTVTEFINYYDIFPELNSHVLSKGNLYEYVLKHNQEGALLWNFAKRGDDISVLSIHNRADNLLTVDKNFLSEKNCLKFEKISYFSKKGAVFIKNQIRFIDYLLEKYIDEGFDSFKSELEMFVDYVFMNFSFNFSNLLPIAWDFFPKNCFICLNKREYLFFDDDAVYNTPLDKSYYLFCLITSIDLKFNFSEEELRKQYLYFINKYQLNDTWEISKLERQREQFAINNSDSYLYEYLQNSALLRASSTLNDSSD